jgi:hypothetical protein
MTETVRLRPSSRAAGSLIGAIVTALGGTCIAVYSGKDIDLELLGIAILGAAGAWLLLSAIAAGLSNARASRRASARATATLPADDGFLSGAAGLRESAKKAAEEAKAAKPAAQAKAAEK